MQNSSPISIPSVGRRLICLIYESLLLIAVEMLAIGFFLMLTANQHTPLIDHARQLWLFLATGTYFVYQWIDSGHTLAMKTWRIKLVLPGSAKIPFKLAAVRYMLVLASFLPALLAYNLLDLHSKAAMGAIFLANFAAWALSPLLDKNRQYLHDRLLGTKLIQLPKKTKA